MEEGDGDSQDEPRNEGQDGYSLFTRAGIFALGSSTELSLKDAMRAYYMRPTVERGFGHSKGDLDILPIRCHSEATIQGYLCLRFLLLIGFVEL